MKELFEGNEPLFRGLFIHDKWDWGKKYPVIRISFADGVVRNREELDEKIHEMLAGRAHKLNITLSNKTISGKFSELIRATHQKYGSQVVVLIDEYDKPILDNITDEQAAIETREGLKNLYSILKDADPHLKFCLLTGVRKAQKALNKPRSIPEREDNPSFATPRPHIRLEELFENKEQVIKMFNY